jgi:hypothetical protein
MIDREGRELRTVRAPSPPPERFARELLKRNFINGSSVLLRKECLEKVALFNEALPVDVDGDMWFRLLKQGCRFGHVGQPLLKYRRHPQSLSRNYRLMQACKDRVRLSVLEAFSVEELFGDVIRNGGFDAGRAYTQLALALARDLNFRAAHAAVERAWLRSGASLGRIFLCMGLRAMRANIMLELVVAVRRASDHFRRMR